MPRAGWYSERRTFHRRFNGVNACSHPADLNGLDEVSVCQVSLPLELGCLDSSLC